MVIVNQIKEVRRFLIKLFIFSLPVVIMTGAPFLMLLLSGELMTVDAVIQKQRQNSRVVMWGLAYSYPIRYYKLNAVLKRSPEVIVLGSSRVMEFRSCFFKTGQKFYNAGGVADNIVELKYFLKSIPRRKGPKIIILGIDQDFLRAGADLSDQHVHEMRSHTVEVPPLDLVWEEYEKFPITRVLKSYLDWNIKRIGLMALFKNQGFLNDGSFYYGDIIHGQKGDAGTRMKKDFEHIRNKHRWYKPARDVSTEAYFELEEFLKECRARNIYVVGFLPPYAHIVYQKLKSFPYRRYDYLSKLAPTLKELMMKYGFSFYNFMDMSSIGSPDSEAIDGMHGSEKTYLRMFIIMARTNSILRGYAKDISYLETRLRDAKNSYSVFDISEF